MMRVTSGPVVVLDPIDVAFTVEEILRTPPFPRWASSTHSGERLRATVERLHDDVDSAVSIRGMYATLPTGDSGIDRYDPPTELLASEYVLPGVLTIGADVRDGGDPDGLLDELVGDAMENVALQLARVELLTAVRDAANERGLNTTRVFPPGTRGDDWDVENRAFMFEALPTERIDVFLEDGRTTTPRKTFTFAMGLDPDIEQAELLLSCSDCAFAADCPYVGSVVA